MKRGSTLLLIRDKTVKLYRNNISHLSDWQKPKSLTTHSVGKVVGKQARSCIAGGSAKWYNPCGGQFGKRYQNYKCIYPLTQQSLFWEFILQIHLTDTKQWIYITMQCSMNLWQNIRNNPTAYRQGSKSSVYTPRNITQPWNKEWAALYARIWEHLQHLLEKRFRSRYSIVWATFCLRKVRSLGEKIHFYLF